MDIESIKKALDLEIEGINSLQMLEEFRLKYLGRKGLFARLTGSIPGLPQEERAGFGREINLLKNRIASFIEDKEKAFAGESKTGTSGGIDIGMPGVAQELGHLHLVTQVTSEICAVFERMGFCIIEGPEVETEENNFTGLNIPLEHPSRDAFDTFYLKEVATSPRHPASPAGRHVTKLLLRSHTSPVQIRVMKSRKPPLAVVVPGRVYRPDATDASHSSMFHQIEGFLVDKGIRFSDLKGVLEVFARAVFGDQIKMRFRPHFFPFTEPSAEVDISCIICKGGHKTEEHLPAGRQGEHRRCSVCGGKGWLEILGSGMIHPNVFKYVGYDPKKYSGFAFGMGVERVAMLKYGINDIRLFLENDLRFLEQF